MVLGWPSINALPPTVGSTDGRNGHDHAFPHCVCVARFLLPQTYARCSSESVNCATIQSCTLISSLSSLNWTWALVVLYTLESYSPASILYLFLGRQVILVHFFCHDAFWRCNTQVTKNPRHRHIICCRCLWSVLGCIRSLLLADEQSSNLHPSWKL